MCLISALEQGSVLQVEIKQLKQVRESLHLVSQKPCFLYVHLSGEIMSDGHLLEKINIQIIKSEQMNLMLLLHCPTAERMGVMWPSSVRRAIPPGDQLYVVVQERVSLYRGPQIT